MTSEKLKKAREYMAREPEDQPYFHLTGGTGWINDPNGFSVYQNRYHLFYQHNPYDVAWGNIHWGHACTDDFVTWERLPEAMAPDQPYDEAGCFSGSAVETDDGKHLLVYTGVRKVTDESGETTEYQQQCIAVGDGVNYEKYELNPVIRTKDIPAGHNLSDFRDPKIWKESGTYYLVAGSRGADGSGVILRYCSTDGLQWKYDGIVEECRNEIGKMWECPDYFALDDKQVLLFSPQEVAEGSPEFRVGFNTVAMTGSTDAAARRFLREHVQAVDYGFEFYAPQTTETKDGRRIMTAWMYDWATMGEIKSDRKWNGQMILPRELSVRNGRLCQRPVREIENYYGACTEYSETQAASFPQISSSCMDLSIRVRHTENCFRELTMHITEDPQNELRLTYIPSEDTVILVHKEHGAPHDRISERRFRVSGRNGDMDLRILIDKYSAEIFMNDGEQTVTAEIGNHSEVKTISFSCEGDALIRGVKHDLQFGS